MISNVVERFATPEPTCCAVCRRHATGLAYMPPRSRGPAIWVCGDPGCNADAAREVYTMPQAKLDDFERIAALAGGSDAGAYLDEIGITDLAMLDELQWQEFLRRVVAGYEHELRRKILSGEAPF